MGFGFPTMSKGGDNTVIFLALGGAAAYYAYTQGWLSSFGLSPASATVAAPASTPTAPAPTTTTPAATCVGAGCSPTGLPYGVTPGYTYTPSTGAAASGNKPIPAGVTPAGPLGAIIAQSMANAGATAAQINAAIAAQQANVAGSPVNAGIAGLGRTVVVLPRRHVALVLPRNYRRRAA